MKQLSSDLRHGPGWFQSRWIQNMNDKNDRSSWFRFIHWCFPVWHAKRCLKIATRVPNKCLPYFNRIALAVRSADSEFESQLWLPKACWWSILVLVYHLILAKMVTHFEDVLAAYVNANPCCIFLSVVAGKAYGMECHKFWNRVCLRWMQNGPCA